MTDHEKMACELLADEYDREGVTGEAACVRDGYTGSLDEDCALRAITAAYNKGRADMRKEAAELVRECEQTFRFYEQSHLAKKTQEGDEKAYRNKMMADKCAAFLALKETPDAK